jgi:hypothetical protein
MRRSKRTKNCSAEEDADAADDDDSDDDNNDGEPLNCIRKLCSSNLDKDTGYHL